MPPIPFAIFRKEDATTDLAIMRRQPISDVVIEGGGRLVEAGIDAGHDTRILFSAPGFSLVKAWFKSGYPLPRHSHDVDCLYYITAGSLRVGTEELGAGDGFFVGASVPYTYTPGPDGVEVLEFRASNAFDIKLLANNPAFWAKALETVSERREGWADEPRPGERADQTP